jgi:hypothetical protein
MFQVIYECANPWPEQGTMQLDMPRLVGEIHVSPVSAKRRANGYLTCEVGLPFRPGEPTLHWGERPVWRMPIYLYLRGYGQVGMFGTIDVDATTRDVIPLPPQQIATIQDRAHELASHFAPSTEPAG